MTRGPTVATAPREAQRSTFTDKLRVALKREVERARECPACGHRLSRLHIAKQIGVSPFTIVRFLSGRAINSKAIDKIDAWIQLRRA